MLTKMKTGSASGPDGLPTEFYGAFRSEIVKVPARVFNALFAAGTFPASFSRAVLLPKPGGDPAEPVLESHFTSQLRLQAVFELIGS